MALLPVASVIPQCSADTVPPSKVAPPMEKLRLRNTSITSSVVAFMSSSHPGNKASDIDGISRFDSLLYTAPRQNRELTTSPFSFIPSVMPPS
ncbi:hypothetical protein IMSAG192_00472 [Muribaculaceae bacterium]|nr:hypothetical protein IMSAG192_00472 [Muribaculaceae bacterium]